jgi:hypothetical protein
VDSVRTRIGIAVRILGAGVIAAGTMVGVTPAADAAIDQLCLVNEVATFSDPVTDTPRTVTVTVHGQLFNCTNGSASTGTYTEVATLPNYTCTSLFYQGSGIRVLNWTNTAIAPTSMTYNRTSSRVGGNVEIVLLGEISSGTFTPDPAKAELVALQPNPLACATVGVTQVSLVGTLIIGL